MDILVESSIIIASERGLIDLDDLLRRHGSDFGALSAIGITELQFGY